MAGKSRSALYDDDLSSTTCVVATFVNSAFARWTLQAVGKSTGTMYPLRTEILRKVTVGHFCAFGLSSKPEPEIGKVTTGVESVQLDSEPSSSQARKIHKPASCDSDISPGTFEASDTS